MDRPVPYHPTAAVLKVASPWVWQRLVGKLYREKNICTFTTCSDSGSIEHVTNLLCNALIGYVAAWLGKPGTRQANMEWMPLSACSPRIWYQRTNNLENNQAPWVVAKGANREAKNTYFMASFRSLWLLAGWSSLLNKRASECRCHLCCNSSGSKIKIFSSSTSTVSSSSRCIRWPANSAAISTCEHQQNTFCVRYLLFCFRVVSVKLKVS